MTEIKLFDTYSETYKPLNNKKVTIYNCGPTVYNHIHIGNARPLITFDVLYRFLNYLKVEVHYVSNITDIDDKIIYEAKKQNVSEHELSEHYFAEYLKIKKMLNTLPMINPKVSDYIQDIIEYINLLVQKEKAYLVDGDVYFDTAKVLSYGTLSKKNLNELLDGARVEIDYKKKTPNDFVLWKKTDEGISWKTKWSNGRPGWHTECSFLINRNFGEQVDIHGGGMDLKFPHHENENAHNVAFYGKNLAKIWLHVGMINFDNQKMSKSLNNFILVKDILKNYDYQALRWFFYQNTIASPLNFSFSQMDLMQKEVNKFKKSLSLARTSFVLNNLGLSFDKDEFIADDEQVKALSDNLNFPNAITILYRLNKELNQVIKSNDIVKTKSLYLKIYAGLDLMGINFSNEHDDLTVEQIKMWKRYLNNKNFIKADELRQVLMTKGVL